MMDYGRAIRILRAAKNLSQKDLAELAGVDASYISLIERGSRQPSLQKVDALARALKVPGPLVSLLAAEKDDLAGIDPTTAGALGAQLLDVLIAAHNS
jgi:transcriptional regulator with XRE-family HTH domain